MKLDRYDMKEIADAFLRIKSLSEATVFMDGISHFTDPKTKLVADAKLAVHQSLNAEIGEAWNEIFKIIRVRTHEACNGDDAQEASSEGDSRSVETSERP